MDSIGPVIPLTFNPAINGITSAIELLGPVHTFFVFYDSTTSEFVGVNRASGSLYGWRRKSLKELVRTKDNDALFGGHVLL